MQGLVMQNDFLGGNIPIVGCFKTGGQVSEESRAAESGILPRLTNPISDVTRKERLYLLGTSAIGITTIVLTGLILLRRGLSQRERQKSAQRGKNSRENIV